MGFDANRFNTGIKALRIESGRLVVASEIAARIENFEATPEGTLLSVRGPAPYVPDYGDGWFNYGRPHGIFHAVLPNANLFRDVLLIHTGNEVRVFNGADQTWITLIGPSAAVPQVIADLPDDAAPRFPTQFVATPTGVVIIPQGHNRAYFYDGETCLPLGYRDTPGAPYGNGPEPLVEDDGTGTIVVTPNEVGYFGGQNILGIIGGACPDFGHGRLGTAQTDVTGSIAGVILESAFQAAYQWIDIFGNLSPLSARSNTVSIQRQEVSKEKQLDHLLKMALWTGLQNGPEGTIGKILSRTRDMKNSGTADLFEVTGNSVFGTSGSYATIPDNVSEKWPDNVPDVWLFTKPTDVMAVPEFKLACLAFGRLWIGGIRGNESAILPSVPGRWGTFLKWTEEYPDPSGGEITGMWNVAGGMLVTTNTSTFLITPSDDGRYWIKATLHPTMGCVAPSSFQNLPDGTTMWLSREGFCRYTHDEGVRLASEQEQTLTERINPGRACQACAAVDLRSREYRCWAPLDGNVENTQGFIFDYENNGWRRRQGEKPRAVCVTRDHRAYMLIAGYVEEGFDGTPSVAPSIDLLGGRSLDLFDDEGEPIDPTQGVWLLDHEVRSFTAPTRVHRIETSWIEGLRSKEHKSPKMIYVWLRETYKGSASIEIHRDWRKRSRPVFPDPGKEMAAGPLLYAKEDVPAFWGSAKWGDTKAEWTTRRPFWQKLSIYVPDCEVYKIIITSQSRIEFIGISLDEQPHAGSARTEGK